MKKNTMDRRQLDMLTRHAEVSEKVLERYLTDRSRALGWRCLKYSNPQEAGYPDRLLLLPGGQVVWVELKSAGRKAEPRQLARHGELRRMGHTVVVADCRATIDELLTNLDALYGHI